MSELRRAVDAVIEQCLAVKPGEQALVISDPGTADLGQALRDQSAGAGADSVLMLMDARANDGAEPPPTVAAALRDCDVFIAPTTKSLSHTQARKAASDAGARGATMPGVTADVLARVMAVDFPMMARRSQQVAELLGRADEARLTCPRDSDLTFDLSGRQGIADDGDLRQPGSFGNLPCGEGFISPAGGEGRLVASSLASLGLSPEPAVLTVSDGRIVAAEGGFGPQFLDALRTHGDAGSNLAELGVGTNDRATLIGNILEDEKILGTVHVAFGASAGIGGTVSVPVHLDAVVLEATLQIGGETVLERGRWAL